jgi:hypothetical protein
MTSEHVSIVQRCPATRASVDSAGGQAIGAYQNLVLCMLVVAQRESRAVFLGC